MAFGFVKKTWKDRISEYPTRRTLTKEDGSTELVTVSRSEGTVSQEGDAFSADNMNDLETRVDNALNEANSNLKEVIKLSLTLDSSGYGTIALPDGWTYQNCHIISERISVGEAAYGHYASTLTTPNYCGLYGDGILYYNNVNAPSAVVDVWLQKD